MAWVTPGATKRKAVCCERVSSENVCAMELKSLFCGRGSPKKNGRMLLSGMVGGPSAAADVPWARMTVPCGIDPIRTTDARTAGSVVLGTVAQIPGSMCSPAPVLDSLICCM